MQEIQILILVKEKNMKPDLKARQYNALRTMILQESFGEI